MSVVVHLNGGPQDDEMMALSQMRATLLVPGLVRSAMPPEDMGMTASMRTGVYEMRRDGNGRPVPHSLAGEYEFDWKGWH